MTTEQPTTQQPTAPRLLRRRSDDRVIGGVASGLGDYFNVDPLLIRIALVGLMVFGGMGLFLYVAAWLLVPDDTTERSIAQRLLGRAGLGGGFIATLLIVVGTFVLISILGNIASRSGGVPVLGFALVVILLGAWILRRDEPMAVTASEPEVTATAPAPQVAARRAPRPRSPLGWYVMGAMLVGIGLLAVITNLADAEVGPGHFFGLALAVLGIGLVIGTWWGNARVLILLGLLILPFAFAASLIQVPIEGGWGNHRFRPASVEEVRGEYRLVGGEIYLDLTDIAPTEEPIVIAASVAMGEVSVLLPDDADLQLDAAVGGGRFRILGDSQGGTTLTDHYQIDGDGQRFELDLEAGLGVVQVQTIQFEAPSR